MKLSVSRVSRLLSKATFELGELLRAKNMVGERGRSPLFSRREIELLSRTEGSPPSAFAERCGTCIRRLSQIIFLFRVRTRKESWHGQGTRAEAAGLVPAARVTVTGEAVRVGPPRTGNGKPEPTIQVDPRRRRRSGHSDRLHVRRTYLRPMRLHLKRNFKNQIPNAV